MKLLTQACFIFNPPGGAVWKVAPSHLFLSGKGYPADQVAVVTEMTSYCYHNMYGPLSVSALEC